MIFIADNLAFFPYNQIDEPLFIIHKIEALVSINGQNIMSSFKKLLSKVPTKKIGEDAMEVDVNEDSDEDDDLKAEYIYSKIYI